MAFACKNGRTETICRTEGIDVANATKLLYQKRPLLFPILDKNVRRIMSIYWVGQYSAADYIEVFKLALHRFREIVTHGPNEDSLQRIQQWLEAEPSVTQGISLSKLRIIDILAWGSA